MKKGLKAIFILLLAGSFFTGCGKEKVVSTPVEKSKVYGEDFRVTITSAQNWYKSDAFKKGCLFTLRLEYIGKEPEILIYHGDPLASLGIDCQNGKSVIGGGTIESIGRKTTLKKGEPYEVIFDADDWEFWVEMFQEMDKSDDEEIKKDLYDLVEISAIQNGTLKKGAYEAVAYVDFSVEGGEDKEDVDYEIRLPLTFEIQ